MSRKNVVITFDSARFCVVVNGQLIADEPSVIIRKKSESPVAIAVGKDAYEMKKSLSPNQMEVSPFRQGKILDDVSAKLFIKYLLKSKLKISTFSNLFILVPTGISEDDENNVERVFLSCGYSNVNLIKRADILTKIIALNNKNAMIYIDEDTTELIVSDSQSGFSSYAIDLATSALSENLRDYFLRTNKLKLTVEESQILAKEHCSLSLYDNTKIIAKGVDAITDSEKSVILYARDLFYITSAIYRKITDLLKAVLLDLPDEIASQIIESGIILLGNGSLIMGIQEFIYKETTIGCIQEKPYQYMMESFASLYFNDNPIE